MPERWTMQRNFQAFNSETVVRKYRRWHDLTESEAQLIQRFITPGSIVLDLGVGTGRTTRPLAERCSQYVGLDYAPRMLAACRRRFPTTAFTLADAARLPFADEHFDIAFFSFNGLDYLHPIEHREEALNEISRVLRRDGYLIFSSHNARALVRPFTWSHGSWKANFRRFLVRVYQSLRLTIRAVSSGVFWRGQGYVRDVDHGLQVYQTTPGKVTESLERNGLRLIDRISAAPPGDPSLHSDSPWAASSYYYVAKRRD